MIKIRQYADDSIQYEERRDDKIISIVFYPKGYRDIEELLDNARKKDQKIVLYKKGRRVI